MRSHWLAAVCLIASASARADDRIGHGFALEVGEGMSIITLGSRQYAFTTAVGLEKAWPARLTRIRGWNRIEFQEFASFRVSLNRAVSPGAPDFDVFWVGLGFRWIYPGDENYATYFEFGSGLSMADRVTGDLTSRFNFASFAGVGFFASRLPGSPRVGFRFIHISNAGTQGPNGGVNQLHFLIGIRL